MAGATVLGVLINMNNVPPHPPSGDEHTCAVPLVPQLKHAVLIHAQVLSFEEHVHSIGVYSHPRLPVLVPVVVMHAGEQSVLTAATNKLLHIQGVLFWKEPGNNVFLLPR